MASPSTSRPGRSLAILGLILVAMVTAMAITGTWTPRLGLDLRGGTSVTLQPKASGGGKVTDTAINEAVKIIRNRVNSLGVAESEVTKQGTGSGQTITVSVPGASGRQVLNLVGSTAELRFRQVLAEAPAVNQTVPTPVPSGSPSASPGAAPAATPAATPATPAATPATTPSTNGRALPEQLRRATATPTASTPAATSAPAAAPSAAAPSPAASAPAPVASAPVAPVAPVGSTLTPELAAQLQALDCTKLRDAAGGSTDDPKKPLVTCDQEGRTKYALAAAEVVGTDVKSASAGLPQSGTVGSWEVLLDFTDSGTKKFGALTQRVVSLPPPTNQVAIVLDGQVVSAPSINQAILTGNAQITGSFTKQQATDLANVLKYGALPLAFEKGEAQSISPTLGKDQLRAGLLAGAIGLVLVMLYLLVYYRGLGLVAIASLLVAGSATYCSVVLLGKTIGFALTLAGVAGLIVSVGITADSFIVYFERLRDEVRDGKSLRVAVETGWKRAWRTILTADFVSFLAAAVLYVLAVGGVKGFAFTLGLTTIIDVVVVFLFTHPVVSLLARTSFFGNGHPLSGLDPRRLGARTRPAAASRGTRPSRPTAAGQEA